MPHVLARPEREPGRPAHRTSRIKIGKSHSFPRHFIKPRSSDTLLAKASQISVSEIITHDPDNIGF